MKLKEYLKSEGYLNLKKIEGRGICGTFQFIFTHAIIFGMDEYGYEGRYCYHTKEEAEIALKYWDGKDDPIGNWIVYKGHGGDRKNSKL